MDQNIITPEPEETFSTSEKTTIMPPGKNTKDVLEYFSRLAKNGIEKGSSDIFLSSGCKPLYRIDGKTIFLEKEPILSSEIIEYYIQTIMSDFDKKKLKENLEHDFGVTIENGCRFRINTFYQRNGISAAMRIIPNRIFSFEELKLPSELKKIVDIESGLILCTGAAGSGKSTTLATIIDQINQKYKKHIITIEDPIEYLHENKKSLVEQRSVDVDTLSFSNALRSSLRQAPDVLLVGELRDLESLSLAISAAETGTLVFGTLHSNNAAGTINRIIDIFPADQQNQVRIQLSQSLQSIIWQKLLPHKSGKGRVAACEILFRNPAIANLIRENKIYQIESAIETSSKDDNMLSFREMMTYLLENQEINKETSEKTLQSRR